MQALGRVVAEASTFVLACPILAEGWVQRSPKSKVKAMCVPEAKAKTEKLEFWTASQPATGGKTTQAIVKIVLRNERISSARSGTS